MRITDIDPHAQAVGQRVREEMERQHIRQAALAARLGLSQQAVSRRLSGRVPFNVSELAVVGRLLDVSPDAFMPTPADAA